MKKTARFVAGLAQGETKNLLDGIEHRQFLGLSIRANRICFFAYREGGEAPIRADCCVEARPKRPISEFRLFANWRPSMRHCWNSNSKAEVRAKETGAGVRMRKTVAGSVASKWPGRPSADASKRCATFDSNCCYRDRGTAAGSSPASFGMEMPSA